MNRGSLDTQGFAIATAGGFNEAPIHESGKCDPTAAIRDALSAASMRPRFMNRGSPCPCLRLRTEAVSFNEAPIHESGK